MYSNNDKYLFFAKDFFKDQIFETRRNFITTVKIANQNVTALVDREASVNHLNIGTFNHQQLIKKTFDIKKSQNKSMHLPKIVPPFKNTR